MPKSVDLKFLEKMADKAKRLEGKIGSEDHWAKPFYSDLQVFKPEVPRVFIGLNPGGNGKSKQYYEADQSETKMRSGNVPYFNAYLDEIWGDSARRRPSDRGQDRLQIAAQRVFKTMYGDDWENTLRNTPCFNLLPVCSEGSKDQKFDRIWAYGVDWGIELLEYLKPQSIILYSNAIGKTDKSVWRALEQRFRLRKTDAISLPQNFTIRRGIIHRWTSKGVPVIGFPHLSRAGNRNLYDRLSELAARRPFP